MMVKYEAHLWQLGRGFKDFYLGGGEGRGRIAIRNVDFAKKMPILIDKKKNIFSLPDVGTLSKIIFFLLSYYMENVKWGKRRTLSFLYFFPLLWQREAASEDDVGGGRISSSIASFFFPHEAQGASKKSTLKKMLKTICTQTKPVCAHANVWRAILWCSWVLARVFLSLLQSQEARGVFLKIAEEEKNKKKVALLACLLLLSSSLCVLLEATKKTFSP